MTHQEGHSAGGLDHRAEGRSGLGPIALLKSQSKQRLAEVNLRVFFVPFANSREGMQLSFLQETFQQESQEIWEGVELTIPANILVTKLDAVFYIGIRFPLDEIV